MAEPNPIFVIHFGTQMSNAQATTNEATRRPFSQTTKTEKRRPISQTTNTVPFPDNKRRNKKAPFPDNNEATWRSLSQIIVRDL
jgi:hypothetical protein